MQLWKNREYTRQAACIHIILNKEGNIFNTIKITIRRKKTDLLADSISALIKAFLFIFIFNILILSFVVSIKSANERGLDIFNWRYKKIPFLKETVDIKNSFFFLFIIEI